MERRGRGAHFLRASGPVFFVCRLRLRGFCDSFSFAYPLSLFENFTFSLRRARAARGPLLSAPAESRQRQAQGSFTPLRIPGPKWGAGRPLWKPPSPRWRGRPGRTPRRFAAGASVPLGKARAPARSPRPPHLHRFGLGASPPCPPRSQPGNVCRSCAQRLGQRSLRLCGNASANLRGSSCRVSG